MLRRILSEPLVIFLLLGMALFGLFGVLQGPAAPSEKVIRIGPVETTQMVENFERTWRRPPTEDERQALIDGLIRQEVLVREAQSLGLDQGDAVIRQRLAQKMQFLLEGMVSGQQPSDAELAAHLAEKAESFRRPGMLAFEQVYLGEGGSEAQARAALTALRDGAAPDTVGRSTLLPGQLPLAAEPQIDATFGAGFAARAAALPLGTWSGPVTSGYGQHLVRVTERQEAFLPPLAEIRDRVLDDWQAETAQRLTEEQMARLTAQYRVELPEQAE